MCKIIIADENLKSFSDYYNEILAYSNKAFNDLKVPEHFIDGQGRRIDQRDFFDLATCFRVSGNTPEEKQADMTRQCKEMVDAFKSPDPTKKEKYLNLMFDKLDSAYFYYDNEIKDKYQFQDMLCAATLNQALAVKRNEYPEYFSKRYNTLDKAIKKGFNSMMIGLLGSKIQSIKDSKNLDLKIKPSAPYEMLDMVGMTNTYLLSYSAIKSIENNLSAIDFHVPKRFYKEAQSTLNDANSFSSTFETLYSDMDQILNYDKYTGVQYENLDMVATTLNSIYINGRSLDEITKEEILTQKTEYKSRDLTKMSEIVFRRELLKGTSVISMAIPEFIDNKMQIKILDIKPNIEKLKNDLEGEVSSEELNKLPLQSDVDKLYENSSKYYDEIKTKVNNYLEKTKDATLKVAGPTRDVVVVTDEAAKEGVQLYEKQLHLIDKAKETIGVPSNGSISVDDFSKLASYIDIKGESEDEKIANFTEEYIKMLDAFNNNDAEKKKEYFLMMLNKYDNSLLALKKDIVDPNEFKNIIASTQMPKFVQDQIYLNKKEFITKYNDPIDVNRFNIHGLIHHVIDQQVMDIYDAQPHTHKLSVPEADKKEYDFTRKISIKHLNDSISNKTTLIDIPTDFCNATEENNKSIEVFMNSMAEAYGINDNISLENKVPRDSVKVPARKAFYVKDKSVESIALDKLKKSKQYKGKEIPEEALNKESANVLREAFTKGDKTISCCTKFQRSNGKFITSVVNFKPDVEEIRKAELAKHSWFRLTFFNWGPFKIDLPPEKKEIDKMYKAFDADKIANKFDNDLKADLEAIKNIKVQDKENNKEFSKEDLKKENVSLHNALAENTNMEKKGEVSKTPVQNNQLSKNLENQKVSDKK